MRGTRRINVLIEEWQRTVAGQASKIPGKIVDLLEANPYCTISWLSESMGVAYTTAQRAVEKLCALGIFSQVGENKRDRVYCATQIMAILDEPASIKAR